MTYLTKAARLSIIGVLLLFGIVGTSSAQNLLLPQGLKEAIYKTIDTEASGSRYVLSEVGPSMPADVVVDKAGKHVSVPAGPFSRLWTNQWIGSTPSQSLVMKLFEKGVRSASVSLPEKKTLSRGKLPTDGDSIAAISFPVFSEDQRDALVLIDWAGAGLLSSKEALLFRKVGQGWKVAGRRPISNS